MTGVEREVIRTIDCLAVDTVTTVIMESALAPYRPEDIRYIRIETHDVQLYIVEQELQGTVAA
jgi:hypothetical protein